MYTILTTFIKNIQNIGEMKINVKNARACGKQKHKKNVFTSTVC